MVKAASFQRSSSCCSPKMPTSLDLEIACISLHVQACRGVDAALCCVAADNDEYEYL